MVLNLRVQNLRCKISFDYNPIEDAKAGDHIVWCLRLKITKFPLVRKQKIYVHLLYYFFLSRVNRSCTLQGGKKVKTGNSHHRNRSFFSIFQRQ